MRMKRVFLIVLDSLGIGAMPDACDFGDCGANTLFSISKSESFNIPNLAALGLGHIDGVDYIERSKLSSAVCRLGEKSRGKDTTVGHWELSGIVTENPMLTFPEGFPRELITEFEKRIGRGTLCGMPYSGTDVIRDFGAEHIKTEKPIIYTSADSVFQIAAHEDIIPPNELYEICKAAREMLIGKWAIGRVIARPFSGRPGEFFRTDRRRDFSLRPSEGNMLTSISDCGGKVIGVGKISDIFAGVGIKESYPTHSNDEGINITLDIMKRDFFGLCFTNLVDFDMKFGHRQDIDGYAAALSAFDKRLPELISSLRSDDCLIIVADHGCDPADKSTDHTREYIPCIIHGEKISAVNLGTRGSFADVGKTVCGLLVVSPNFEAGEDFSTNILS